MVKSSTNQNRFSIILIFKNEERGLRETLNRIFLMDYPKNLVEVICINDGSTDDSASIAKQYNTHLINLKKNHGISFARNLGIKHSKGNIIILLDAHMYIKDNNFLQVLDSYFQKNADIAAVCGSYGSLTDKDKNYIRDIRRYGMFGKSQEGKDEKISLNNFIPFSSAIGAYRKELFNVDRFPTGFENSAGEDVFLQIELQNKGYVFFYTSKIKGIHDAQISTWQLYNKMLNEVRSCGNILLKGSKMPSLEIPYINYFLSYPLIFLCGILLSILASKYFLIISGIGLICEILPLMKNFRVAQYSFTKKLFTSFYLMSLSAIQAFYLPYYIVKNRPSFSEYLVIIRLLFIWELQKIEKTITFKFLS